MLTGSVFGRDKEMGMILRWISNSGGVMDPNVSAFSIVGMGGFGKTTLARLIYNEVETKMSRNFNSILWVSISDIFDTLDALVITRKILQDVTKKSYGNIDNLNTLQRNLQANVASKKFFLVLDDIWRDDPDSEMQLKQIIAPLTYGRKGSKILVTTRMNLVADMIEKVIEEPQRKKNRLILGGMEEHDFIKLFNKNVFRTEDPNVNKNFQKVAKQIARKLGGSPLAAKAMERLLKNCKTIQDWNQIAKQGISEIDIDNNGIIAALRLNYYHLPGNAQQCFRFCSLFPQDHKFKRDELVKMWIGLGFTESRDNTQRPEDTGANYFDLLIRKSFFHLSEGSENCYVMHDLMHAMAVTVSSGECLRTENVSESIPSTIRHLSIKIKSLLAFKEISHLNHLQSLFIEYKGEKPENGDLKKLEKALKVMKSMRLLSLIGDNLFELPISISSLIHLLYISLEQTRKKELDWFPSSIYKLYHIQIMIFKAHGMQGLTEAKMDGMSNLINLRSLNVHPSVMRKIPRIGTLICLQNIEVFITKGRKINELRDLKELRELEIHGLENVSSEEIQEAKMNEKENLRVLSLNWSQGCSNSNQILQNLQPLNNLQKLRILGYKAESFPVVNPFFSNLTSLKLKNCSNLKILPSLGKLPALEYLILREFPELAKIDNSFYGKRTSVAFPFLKELRIQSMTKLESWVEGQGKEQFPRLEVLRIEDCPSLTTLPKLPLTLRQLDVQNVGLNMFPIGIRSLKKLQLNRCPILLAKQIRMNIFPSSIEELKFQHCGDNVSLVSSLRNLVSLTHLDLIRCPDIKSLPPAEVFTKLVSLSSLCILKCNELSSFGGLRALRSLKYLSLSGCVKLVAIPKEMNSKEIKKESPALNLEELHIDYCSLLHIEPIKSLCCTKKLYISITFEEISLPREWLIQNSILKEIEIDDASALETIPPSLTALKSIEKLKLTGASRINSLSSLPISLSDLVMMGCNSGFIEMYKKDNGSNWSEIADIPFVVIS